MQAYSDPSRADGPHALPDVEVFHSNEYNAGPCADSPETTLDAGWYWWSCFPGCLPDSDPIGPFATEVEALADAQGGISHG